MRGVTLAGWLVLEQAVAPSVWAGLTGSPVGEYALMQAAAGQVRAPAVLYADASPSNGFRPRPGAKALCTTQSHAQTKPAPISSMSTRHDEVKTEVSSGVSRAAQKSRLCKAYRKSVRPLVKPFNALTCGACAPHRGRPPSCGPRSRPTGRASSTSPTSLTWRRAASTPSASPSATGRSRPRR